MCQNCEYNSPKYLGRCPNCGSWSSFVEEVEAAEVKNARVSLTGRKDRKKKFATGLLLVSSRIFEKRRASCFTNPDLKDFLEGNGAKSIEFIGVDGNGCVKASVLAATKENYQVSVDLSAVGVANQKKFSKTLKQWQDCGIKIG